jgi:hypothetical protein
MSMADYSVYRNFDDDALAALASIGLLRRARKDVEAGKVGWTEPGGQARGLVSTDGQQVALGARGPADARCDCLAPGVCKHILAAAIWLRESGETPGSSSPADAPPPDVLAEVLALDQAGLFKAAGRAAVRKAASLYQALGAARLLVQGASLVIAIPGLDVECRYIAGAGFAGMLSELAGTSRNALHLLAIAAAWRDNGREPGWPDTVPAPADTAAGLDADERELLARARAIILDVCRSGWSHVSDLAAPQLRALATSARVEAFPRLAGHIRTLAGTVELLAMRDFGADEREALRLAARIFALAHALEHAEEPAVSRLRGGVQRSFEEGAELELLPLGAHWWEQRSGARGLAVAFWDPASSQVLQAVMARRDGNDPGFTKHGAWTAATLWQGAGSASGLGANAIILAGPRLSEDRRIALGGATCARKLPPWRTSDERWKRAGHDDWHGLAARVRTMAGLLGDPADLVLLRPAKYDLPAIDEVRQLLRWTLYDRAGVPLVLCVPYSAAKVACFDNLQAWTKPGTKVEAVLARLDRTAEGGMFEPVALIVDRDGMPVSASLDFDPAPAKSPLWPRLGKKLLPSAPSANPPTPVRRAIGTVLTQLEHKAMTGHLHLAGGDELLAAHQSLLGLGLDALATPLAAYLSAPEAGKALALVHIAHTCLELDTGSWHD